MSPVFRDDIAARAFAGTTLETHVQIGGGISAAHTTAASAGAKGTTAVYAGDLSGRSYGSVNNFNSPGLRKAVRFGQLFLTQAQYGELIDHRGGCACGYPAALFSCWRCTTPVTFAEAEHLGFLEDRPAEVHRLTVEDERLRSLLAMPSAPVVSVTLDELGFSNAPEAANAAAAVDAPLTPKQVSDALACIRESDAPGIAAMAAKNVEPAPKPVQSIGGEVVTDAEMADALAAIRAKRSQPVSTPKGLLVVAGFDHRLGAWGRGV